MPPPAPPLQARRPAAGAGAPRAAGAAAGGGRAGGPEKANTRTLNASLAAALDAFGRAHAEAVGFAEQARP